MYWLCLWEWLVRPYEWQYRPQHPAQWILCKESSWLVWICMVLRTIYLWGPQCDSFLHSKGRSLEQEEGQSTSPPSVGKDGNSAEFYHYLPSPQSNRWNQYHKIIMFYFFSSSSTLAKNWVQICVVGQIFFGVKHKSFGHGKLFLFACPSRYLQTYISLWTKKKRLSCGLTLGCD